jgi:hypothetical protein
MKLKLVLATSTLLLGACNVGEPAPESNVAQATNGEAAKKPPEAAGGHPAALEAPLQTEFEMVPLLPDGQQPMDASLPWEFGSHEQRRKQLEKLAEDGSDWAKETLRKLDAGEMHPSELDDSGKTVVAEMVRHSFRLAVPGGGSNDGCAPMPFGSSMFGPWDTGRSYPGG